jgi:hypothetical protein
MEDFEHPENIINGSNNGSKIILFNRWAIECE